MRLHAIDKFKEYLRLISTELDVLSMMEIEIAKYCFANPPQTARRVVNIRRKILDNFTKTKVGKLPATSKDVFTVAFNGASDINLLNSVNLMEFWGLDGIKQDCWIATRDKKFYEFSRIPHHVNLDGEPGKYSAAAVLPEQHTDMYWSKVRKCQSELSIARSKCHENRKVDLEQLVEKVKAAALAVESAYATAKE